MSDNAAARAEKGDDTGEKVDPSSPPPLPGKIPPDMLEKAELWARLERLDLLNRVAGVRIEEQREEHVPAPPSAQSLVSMVMKIKVEIDMLHTASALYDSARQSAAQSATENTNLEAAEYSSEQPAAPSIRQCDAHTDSGLLEYQTSVASRATSSAMEEWSDHQEVCGELTLKGTMDSRRSLRAKCSIDRCMLTLFIPQQVRSSLAVHILVEELAVRLPKGCTDAFEIGNLHENRMNNEICCFAKNQVERDDWIATFRRMGVAILDQG